MTPFDEDRVTELLAEYSAAAEAKSRWRAENTVDIEIPEIATLAERAKRPRSPVKYRIDGWQKVGAFNLLAAQA